MSVGRTCTLVLLLTAATGLAAAAPKISFDKERYDYGNVIYGDTVHEEFTVTNTGDQPLIIEKLLATCGCTKTVKGKDKLPPKESTTIMTSFDTTGLRPGRKEKSIFVHSNDPQRPVVKLTLLADVIRNIVVDPPSLARQLPAFEETVPFSMKLTNAGDRTCALNGVKIQGDGLQVSLAPRQLTVEPGTTTHFTIQFKLKKEPDRYYYMGRLLLETDHPKESEIEIRYLIRLGKTQ